MAQTCETKNCKRKVMQEIELEGRTVAHLCKQCANAFNRGVALTLDYVNELSAAEAAKVNKDAK